MTPVETSVPRPPKIPESVLVVIHTDDPQVLLIERSDHPGFWQSVTGSKDSIDEDSGDDRAARGRRGNRHRGRLAAGAVVGAARLAACPTSTRSIRVGGIAMPTG